MTNAVQGRIKTLIVDDEPLARDKIRELLHNDTDVEIVGECVNGVETIAALEHHFPDLIFLDVQMPEASGFEVLESIPRERLPLIIFVTAYDQYAVRAFEFHAVDYLLKPFDRERFETALERAKVQIRQKKNGAVDSRILALLEDLRAEQKYIERIVIKTGGRVFFLSTAEIDWVESEGNYVRVHSAKKSYLVRETISNLEAQLDPKDFLRIHRSTIVRIDRIQELQTWFHGEYRVIMRDGAELMLSRTYRERLQDVLGKSL